MKKHVTLMIIGCGVLMVVHGVFSQGPQLTLEQKSAFESRIHIDAVNTVVPKMVDVPIFLNENARQMSLVADNEGYIVPSAMILRRQQKTVHFEVSDSFGSGVAQNMMDGALDTFTEFPFTEAVAVDENSVTITDQYDNEMRMNDRTAVASGENRVDIDVKTDQPLTTDMLSLYFDAYVAKPTHIRIASINEQGEEHVVLPEKFFNLSSVYFPKETSNHFRITLRYARPLRISEITFSDKNIHEAQKLFVRFLVQPKKEYDIYINTVEDINRLQQEVPNFHEDKDVAIILPTALEQNDLYGKFDSDQDGVVDGEDNCAQTSNADQADVDGNEKGDACEDFDYDNIINAKDNCPSAANFEQYDEDNDGVGNACDGEESRFMEKYPWIPYVALVAVFVIVSSLIARTLKKH